MAAMAYPIRRTPAAAWRRCWLATASRGQDLPIFTSPLPTHPFAPFRRLGRHMLYRWYHMRDEAY
jgi:hypothetical protein